MNHELPDVRAGFRKSRGTRDQVAKHPLDHRKTNRVLEKHLLPLYWLCQSLWLCGSWQTVDNSSREGNTRLSCLLRNLYAGWEATVKTGHGTMDWFQIAKGVCQGCILSPCLFNLYAESVMPSNYLILYCPLLLLPSIFPAPGSFQVSQFFASGDQNIGVSTSTSVLPMNIQDWFPLGWIG